MVSESTYDEQTAHRESNSPKPDAPWAEIELPVPNNRSHASVVALVECTLVELTHEPVGAEYVAPNAWGTKRTQYIAVDDVGETFRKQHFDERLGWHETTVSRQDVRDELINRLTRSTSSTAESCDVPATDRDTFTVKPI